MTFFRQTTVLLLIFGAFPCTAMSIEFFYDSCAIEDDPEEKPAIPESCKQDAECQGINTFCLPGSCGDSKDCYYPKCQRSDAESCTRDADCQGVHTCCLPGSCGNSEDYFCCRPPPECQARRTLPTCMEDMDCTFGRKCCLPSVPGSCRRARGEFYCCVNV